MIIYNIMYNYWCHFDRFFGEDPPPQSSTITWQVDRKPLALRLLSLSILSLDSNMATPFQLCGIVMPKLVTNLDAMTCTDQEKLSLSLDILSITQGQHSDIIMMVVIFCCRDIRVWSQYRGVNISWTGIAVFAPSIIYLPSGIEVSIYQIFF